MPAPLVRRGLWTLGAVALLVLAFALALPFAASNRLVADRIAVELGAWTGTRVEMASAPEIQLWPFRTILLGVTMTPDEAGAAPVLQSERVVLELSALAALTGDVVFQNAVFERPTLRVEPVAGAPGWRLPAQGGRLAEAIAKANALVAENRSSPDTSALPDEPFGTVGFNGARVVTGWGDGERELLSDATGRLDWPSLDRAGALNAAAVWRGEVVRLDATVAQPLLLAAGGGTPINFSIASTPATFSFAGALSLFGEPYVDGRLNFSTPSLRRVLEWSHDSVAPGTSTGSVTLESRLQGDDRRLRFEDAEIAFDGNPGIGVLDLSLQGKLPTVSGSLAFETFDLASFAAAFTPLEPQAADAQGLMDASFADLFALDLRLSATKATAGSLALDNVAATAKVESGLAAFDISDARAFDGSVQAGLRFDRKPGGGQVELRLLASDIDGAAAGKLAGMTRLMPFARGNVSVILKGTGTGWDTMLERANGSIVASFGPGTLPGIDVEALVERTKDGGFFAFEEVADGSLAIQGAELKATIADGVARIERADAWSANAKIAVTGIVPYVGRGLALSGAVTSAAAPGAQPTADAARARFFVGGTWSAPFVSPIQTDLLPE